MNLPKKIVFVVFLLVTIFLFPRQVKASVQSAASDPDINIELRHDFNATPTLGGVGLINTGDENNPLITDKKAPQLSTISTNPTITTIRQVGEYNASGPIPADNSNNWGVTLSGLTNAGDIIKVPQSGYDIGEGYQAVILYATPEQIAISYTNGGDGIVRGYTIHILHFAVNGNLVNLYQQNIGQGKVIELPCGYPLGTSTGSELVSIRDTGSFMDPRSQKDWWQNGPQTLKCNLSLQPKSIVIGQSSGPAKNQPSLTISGNPIPQPYVGGGGTRDNEFHQLRPYEASPFGMTARYLERDTLFCGNDIVIKQAYELTPNGGGQIGQCTGNSDGSQTCVFRLSGYANIEVDLKNSELPILGNTTLVPNRINDANQLNPIDRLNNYVSWYLNGTVYSAYENLRDILDSANSSNTGQTNAYASLRALYCG